MSWENIEILDPRMEDLLLPDSQLERHCTGAIWSEGPVYFAEGDYVLWSDIPNNRMLKWSAAEGMTVFRDPSNFTNGHTRDREGRLVSCEHGGAGSAAPKRMAASSASWTNTRASASTLPTTWW